MGLEKTKEVNMPKPEGKGKPDRSGSKKDRVTRIQSQLAQAQQQLDKSAQKLSALVQDPNADPAELDDLEDAVADHSARVQDLTAKLAGGTQAPTT